MIQIAERVQHRWLLPFVSAAILFLSLLLLIPYGSAYWSTKMSLGVLLWNFCMAGPNAQATLDFSYCLLVPFIVAYLIYLRWERLAAQPIKGSNGALGLIVFSLLLFWLGLRSEVPAVGFAAMQILLAGIILWLWGWNVFRQLLFPWVFLIFFWPLPFLDTVVAFPLRMIMSHLAYDVLQLVGVPVIQNGTALISGPDPLSGARVGDRFRIDIADPCSGIRSLLALMMISALYANLALPKLWQQWIVFLSSIPLTVIGNLARVLILIAGSIFFGSSFAIGTYEIPSWFHEGAGYMVYGVALGLELGLGMLLVKEWGRRPKSTTPTRVKASQPEKAA